MGKLITFLLLLALVAVVAWQGVRLVREPAARSLGRLAFVLGVGGILTAMLIIGVTQ